MDEEEKKLIKNARKPIGELGLAILDRMNKSHANMAKWGISHLDIKHDDIILDVGCGGGVNVKYFSTIALKVYGIDYSDISVNISIKENSEAIKEGKVEIIEASVSNLPFDDNMFDIVTGFETIYFWPDFKNDLLEVKRVLKNNGIVFFCNEAVYDETASEKQREYAEFLDLNCFNEEILKNYLNDAGFKNIKIFRKGSWICSMAQKIL